MPSKHERPKVLCMAPAKMRVALKRLIRNNGLRLVAAAVGLDPGTVAKFVAGEKLARKSMRALDLGFEQLGDDLGLEPWRAGGKARPKPVGGAPRLRLVTADDGGEL